MPGGPETRPARAGISQQLLGIFGISSVAAVTPLVSAYVQDHYHQTAADSWKIASATGLVLAFTLSVLQKFFYSFRFFRKIFYPTARVEGVWLEHFNSGDSAPEDKSSVVLIEFNRSSRAWIMTGFAFSVTELLRSGQILEIARFSAKDLSLNNDSKEISYTWTGEEFGKFHGSGETVFTQGAGTWYFNFGKGPLTTGPDRSLELPQLQLDTTFRYGG